MDSPLIEVEIKQTVLPRCQEVIAVVDGSKFGRPSLATIVPLAAISKIVTNEGAPSQLITAMCAQGVQILIAAEG